MEASHKGTKPDSEAERLGRESSSLGTSQSPEYACELDEDELWKRNTIAIIKLGQKEMIM